LGRLLADLAEELGVPLDQLSRSEKQRAVRLLEERGAFTYRKSAETVAEALGVSRFTVYNYLNRTGS
ncbi:MAG TPA: helix-turn-helix domain-containing protein, partial [Egibacteraceae bacterium]|nr:helix-turn-helix domain-containing protein [Egibacteraceae bacterium]